MVGRRTMNPEKIDINVIEQAFLTRWAAMDFSTWNEQEVREEFIIPLLHLLGYRKGTAYGLEMEKELRLSEPYHRIGRKRVSIDYAPSLRLRYFWIVEAKPGTDRPMKYGDLLQVHLYATHPEVQANLIVLCNGWEVRVYDARTLRSFDDSIHVCTRDDCFTTFPKLRETLSAESLLTFQRRRLISLAKDTLDVEVDLDRFRTFSSEMSALLHDGECKVRDNATQLRSARFKEWMDGEREELRKASIETLFVKMDLPDQGIGFPVEEFVKRVMDTDRTGQAHLVDQLAMRYRGRPHNIFRGMCLHVLVRLLEEDIQVEPSRYVKSIVGCINELAAENIKYWSGLSRALCHLDNVCMRVAYKCCTRLAMQFMEELLAEGKRAMNAEQRVGLNPSVAHLMVPSAAHLQEILWRQFSRLQSEREVWEGIWTLQTVEAELDSLPASKYPDGRSDLLFWEFQGRSCDTLRAATWNALNDKVDLLRNAGVTSDILEFAALDWERVSRTIPQEDRPPEGFVPSLTAATLARDFLPKVLALRFGAFMAEVRRENPLP
jgi:hypothetical protein